MTSGRNPLQGKSSRESFYYCVSFVSPETSETNMLAKDTETPQSSKLQQGVQQGKREGVFRIRNMLFVKTAIQQGPARFQEGKREGF